MYQDVPVTTDPTCPAAANCLFPHVRPPARLSRLHLFSCSHLCPPPHRQVCSSSRVGCAIGSSKMSGRRSMDDMREMLRSCKGFSSQQRMDFYDSWAETYEQDSDTMDYTAPRQVVDFLDANFSGNREEVRVLDVACGSGLAAKLMGERGFRHFVGVDGSKGMLEQAAKTKLYQDLKLAVLGPEPLPAQSGAFDVVLIVGALRDGFVPVSIIRQLCDAAKPGGVVCMSRIQLTGDSGQRYAAAMEAELQLMQAEGLWSRVAFRELKGYMVNVYSAADDDKYLDGVIYLYRKSL